MLGAVKMRCGPSVSIRIMTFQRLELSTVSFIPKVGPLIRNVFLVNGMKLWIQLTFSVSS